jgi:hypothetical protein
MDGAPTGDRPDKWRPFGWSRDGRRWDKLRGDE